MSETAGLDAIFGRTLEKLSRRALITPHFEKALATADFPSVYPIKVYNGEWKSDGYFHPSSDLDWKELQLYYKFHPGYEFLEERFSPQGLMAMQVGSAIHAVVQSMFIHLGFVDPEDVEHEFTDEETGVSGHIDVRRFKLPDGRVVPVEIKSAGGYFPDKAPLKGHAEQLQLYMDLGCDQAPVGVIFYVEKSYPHRTREFIVERDEEFLKTTYTRFKKVKEAIAFDDPSEFRDCCQKNSKAHKTCPARFVCRIGRPDTK